MISEQFKATVQTNDILKIKIMLKNSLTMDLSFNQFKEMLNYALSFVPNLIEQHDDTLFESQNNWTKDYASALKVDLVDNFSADRIAHLKEVQTFVYADEISQQQRQNQTKSILVPRNTENQTGSRDSHDENHQSTPTSRDSMAALIAGIGVAATSLLFGVIKGWTIVTVASTVVIATCVVGGVTYYLVKKS